MFYIFIEELDDFIEIKNNDTQLYFDYLTYTMEKYYSKYNQINTYDRIKYLINNRKNNKRKRIN